MIYFANNLKQLRDAVDGLIKVMGEKAPVGMLSVVHEETHIGEMQLEFVFVGKSRQVVGEEANGYIPKEGDRKAVLIS